MNVKTQVLAHRKMFNKWQLKKNNNISKSCMCTVHGSYERLIPLQRILEQSVIPLSSVNYQAVPRTVSDSTLFCKLSSCTSSEILRKLNFQAFGFCSWDFHCFRGSSFNGLFLRNPSLILRSTFIERSI